MSYVEAAKQALVECIAIGENIYPSQELTVVIDKAKEKLAYYESLSGAAQKAEESHLGRGSTRYA